MDNFFPEADYKIPETSNYMKFDHEGEFTFRVLSSAIIGYGFFTEENKPVRFRKVPEDTTSMKKDGRVSHFWAFVVYNYEAKRMQILELTQKTIMTPLKALIDNPKWGNPKNYDVTVTRKGMGKMDTEYSVMPNPHTPVSDEIAEAFMKSNINLEALYDGEDPFKQV